MSTVTGKYLNAIIDIRNPSEAELMRVRPSCFEKIGEKIVAHMLMKALVVHAFAETVFALTVYAASVANQGIISPADARNYVSHCAYDFGRLLTAIFRNIFQRYVDVQTCPLVDKCTRTVRSVYQDLELQAAFDRLQGACIDISNSLSHAADEIFG